ncbi:MAG: Tm-1-like ATP-binding domain-containing protein [Thermoleophilaceae bacterium]|nr:Tm-1-like ATP-binding domain-containing protein [Thermoleophilaceae bacterium]
MSQSRTADADRAVLLLGTLDTKGEEFEFLRDRLGLAGVGALLADVGTLEPPRGSPDITREEVGAETGVDVAALGAAGDRGAAIAAMAGAAAALARRLYDEGRIHGVLSAGGSGNTAIATAAMQALPVGVPKLMVSTMASGDTSDYVGGVDVTMMASVTDVAGINSISSRILANAAAAMAGMVLAPEPQLEAGRPLVAATMFGVTTPCVTRARDALEEKGYEVLVFHATGTGGKAMEALVDGGLVSGVLDATTTELCDDLVGGVLSAGPARLEAAGRAGVPQVVSLGALDMVNFGARDTVPAKFEDRNLYVHNPSITLMRTTPEECAEVGRRIARKLAAATGPVSLFVPLNGVSMIDAEGQPFHDPEADAALFDALREGLAGSQVELVELDNNVNDEEFATAMADRLDEHLRGEK